MDKVYLIKLKTYDGSRELGFFNSYDDAKEFCNRSYIKGKDFYFIEEVERLEL